MNESFGSSDFVTAIFKDTEDKQIRQFKIKRTGLTIMGIIEKECKTARISEKELKNGNKRMTVINAREKIARRGAGTLARVHLPSRGRSLALRRRYEDAIKRVRNGCNYVPCVSKARGRNFAKTFEALGHVMHLLADAAVPEHVRNDSHFPSSEYEDWTEKNLPMVEAYVKAHASEILPVDYSKSKGDRQ